MTGIKFECSNCGNCCKTFSFSDKESVPYFDDDDLLCLNNLTLPLYDWEGDVFKKNGKGDLIVPYKIVYDMKNNRSIVLQYTLKDNTCPFLADSSCKVYSERPSTCRIFPCAIKLGEIDSEKNKGGIAVFAFTNHCSSELNREEILEMIGINQGGSSSMNSSEINKKIYDRYGDSYVHCLVKDVIDKTIARFVSGLANQGIIEMPKEDCSIDSLKEKIAGSKFVDISELYKEYNNEDLSESYNQMFDNVKKVLEK